MKVYEALGIQEKVWDDIMGKIDKAFLKKKNFENFYENIKEIPSVILGTRVVIEMDFFSNPSIFNVLPPEIQFGIKQLTLIIGNMVEAYIGEGWGGKSRVGKTLAKYPKRVIVSLLYLLLCYYNAILDVLKETFEQD